MSGMYVCKLIRGIKIIKLKCRSQIHYHNCKLPIDLKSPWEYNTRPTRQWEKNDSTTDPSRRQGQIPLPLFFETPINQSLKYTNEIFVLFYCNNTNVNCRQHNGCLLMTFQLFRIKPVTHQTILNLGSRVRLVGGRINVLHL
jgi:hypothetical protein